MPAVVAFIRAINLGKRRRVGMAKLRGALEAAGYPDVVTHLQSGNVVLAAGRKGVTAVSKEIEAVIRREFGFDADVIVRAAAELGTIIAANPLLKPRVDLATLHVAFLKSRPKAAAVAAIRATEFGRDQFVVNGSEIYLRYHAGQAGSKMDPAFFERALSTPATVRTWKVVTKLHQVATGA